MQNPESLLSATDAACRQKEAFEPSRLVEYGDISVITQNGNGNGADSSGSYFTANPIQPQSMS